MSKSVLRRLVGYGLVGATGIPVDLATVWTASHLGLPGLIATIVGYQTAMTWNYTWQRRYVFNNTGWIRYEYPQYVAADLAGGAARVLAVAALLATGTLAPAAGLMGVPAVVLASAIGILLAFGVTFAGADQLVFTTAEDPT